MSNGNKIKAPKPTPPSVGGIPKELLDVPGLLKLMKDKGNDNYTSALHILVDRFSSSSYARKSGKSPHQLILESVHSLINILNEVFPRNAQDRPLGIPEVALLFGAVLGTAAAPAYAHGEASIEEIEAQIGLFWISVREWLVKGFLVVKKLESSGGAPQLIVPPGAH